MYIIIKKCSFWVVFVVECESVGVGPYQRDVVLGSGRGLDSLEGGRQWLPSPPIT